jgi:hypothetical protein
MGSLFGNIEVRGARENNLMSYTWAPHGLEGVVAWTRRHRNKRRTK